MATGKRIKKIRESLGLDQPAFGKLIGKKTHKKAVSGSAVSRWENDDTIPSSQRLKTIADLGNVSVEYLLYGFNFNENVFFKHLYDIVTYYYFSGDTVKYGLEEYKLRDTVDAFFKANGWEIPLQFDDSDPADAETAASDNYLIKHLNILRSKEYIQSLIDVGAIYNGETGAGVPINGGVDDEAAIAILCEKLLQECIKLRKSKHRNSDKFSDLVLKAEMQIAMFLDYSDFSQAKKYINQFIADLEEYRDNL